MKAIMKQALAALEMPCDRWNGTQTNIVNKAIEALRAATGQPYVPLTKKQVDDIAFQCWQAGDDTTYAVVNAAIAQTDEPVAWMDNDGDPDADIALQGLMSLIRYYVKADAYQEICKALSDCLHVSAQHRFYVPLSNEQIDHIVSARGWLPTMYDICRDIERAVRSDK